MAKKYPEVTVIGMSRSGTPRYPDKMESYPNVKYVKGDCLKPETFREHLSDITGCVHAVGTLLPSKDPQKSYKSLNRDSAINTARELNSVASESEIKP